MQVTQHGLTAEGLDGKGEAKAQAKANAYFYLWHKGRAVSGSASKIARALGTLPDKR